MQTDLDNVEGTSVLWYVAFSSTYVCSLPHHARRRPANPSCNPSKKYGARVEWTGSNTGLCGCAGADLLSSPIAPYFFSLSKTLMASQTDFLSLSF